MDYLLLIVATEAITELLVKSEFFKPLRQWFFERRHNIFFKFIHTLLDCGYCTSVWVAAFVLIMHSLLWNVFYYLCLLLLIHRLSNLFHFFMDKIWARESRI